jgi:hypothetical protein
MYLRKDLECPGPQAQFFNGVDRCPIENGSFVFVRAGQTPRFEDFSEDFAVWVFFYGPEMR